MPLLQLGPRLVAFMLLRLEQLAVARHQRRAFGQPLVYPLRILTGPRQRDLELMWPPMTIVAIEGVSIDLATGYLFQAVEQPKAGQLPGLSAQSGGQRIGCGIANEALQPLSRRDERGPARSSSGTLVSRRARLSTDHAPTHHGG